MPAPADSQPPETTWIQEKSAVVHLDDKNFQSHLIKTNHALVIFYTNWCGHCKKAKPEFIAAANKLKDHPHVSFAAIDCDAFPEVCKSHKVNGYPTIRYFKSYKVMKDYKGARNEKGFYNYMADK